MCTPVVKSLSLSLVALLAVSSALASSPPEREPRPRSQAEIEQGWVEQQQRFEARLAARGLQEEDIPGAILSAPLPGFHAPMKEGASARHARGVASQEAPQERNHGRPGPRE